MKELESNRRKMLEPFLLSNGIFPKSLRTGKAFSGELIATNVYFCFAVKYFATGFEYFCNSFFI